MTRRIRFSIASAAAITAVMAAYFARPETSATQEPLRVNPTTYNCGILRQGATAKATFHLTNTAAVPLRIADILLRCGCTSSEISKKLLDPGETADLEITWEVGSRRNETSTNLLILSTLEDKKLFQTRLELVANVDPDVNYNPVELVFEENQPQERIVTFNPNGMKTLVLSEAFSTNRAFKTTLSPEKRQVSVAFDPRRWHSDIGVVHLVVRTNSPNEPECRVPLIVHNSRGSTARR